MLYKNTSCLSGDYSPEQMPKRPRTTINLDHDVKGVVCFTVLARAGRLTKSKGISRATAEKSNASFVRPLAYVHGFPMT